MRHRWIALGAAAGAIAAVVIAGVLLARDGEPAPVIRAAASRGTPAPKLEGTDPITGRHVSLASYRGKPVVINIWASWCPGCAAEAKDLARFARERPEAQVLGIDYQDSKSGAKAFYRRFGWRHPSIFDPRGTLTAKLGLQGLPSTFFLNERHEIVARIIGETDLAGFEDGLRQAVGA